MIRLKDFLAVLYQSDRLQIIKDGKPIYTGYLALIVHNPQIEAEMDAVITLFRAVPEIKHKQWRERGLMAPMEPEEMPQYAFQICRCNYITPFTFRRMKPWQK